MNAMPPDPALARVASLRARMWDGGFRPVAVYSPTAATAAAGQAGKAPKGSAWQLRARLKTPDAAQSPPEPDALNTGLLADGLRLVDVDVDDVAVAGRVKALALALLGTAPIRWRVNSGRVLLAYRAAEGEPGKLVAAGTVGKVEVLGRGQQAVIDGLHPSGAMLQWEPEPPGELTLDDLVAVTEVQIGAFLAAAGPLIGAEPVAGAVSGVAGVLPRAPSSRGPSADPLDVAAALAVIPNEGPSDWEAWVRVGMATWAATSGSTTGLAAWCGWSERHPAHDPAACTERWAHFTTSPPSRIGAGTLFALAKQARPDWRKPSDGRSPPPPPTEPPPREPDAASPSDEPVPPDCTDEALALRFSEVHAYELRHVAAWGKWLGWDGTRWRADTTLATFDKARAVCRRASSQCDSPRIAAKVASAATVAAVERLAKADRRHAATVEQWDADPWLLNTPGGTVDLRTGRMRRHNPADHLTKRTAVAPGGECPLWHAFLARVTDGDVELQSYLKRMAGYCLTGSIREHALFFAYGTGANGKGVTINTLTGILGDYATVASIETFTASQSDRHPTDLAMLRGARLVTAQETEEGRRWAESRIKAMTGGDPITARFMRQDFFTFEPTFKLVIAGNHRPGLRNVDEAIRRRFNMLPFAVKIPPAERDKDLPDKLKVEWPGILKWAIEGCLEWQQTGLKPPPAVVEATEEYMEAEDALASWMVECTTSLPSAHSSSSELFASWKTWAEGAGEPAGSQKRFSQALQSRGLVPQRFQTGKAGFLRIALKPPPSDGRYGA